MSYVAHHKDFAPFVTSAAPPKVEVVAREPGILRRFFDAFMQSRQRDVDRQITRFVASRSGGTLTR
jgi:hypothetical protein